MRDGECVDPAPILCFLIPRSLKAHLGVYSLCLTEDDRKEIDRCTNLSRRFSITAARIVLRLAICRIAGRGSANDWMLSRSKTGKLKIDNLRDCYCSISHTEEWDAVAVSRGLDIGLDVEGSRLNVSPDVMRDFLSENELLRIEKSGVAQAHELFLEAWAMKEAIVKLSGSGLSEHARLIDTSRGEDRRVSVHGRGRAIMFATRISDLVGGPAQGWLSLALEMPAESTNPVIKMAFYLLTRVDANAARAKG